jgi:integrase
MARVPRHTELQNLVLATTTRQKYDNATTKFLDWCEDNGEDADTAEELDEVLNEYIHHLYHSGGSKSTAINALYGVARYLPGTSALLPLSRRAIRGWSKATPPTPWAPLTWDLTVTIAIQFVRAGRMDFAVATVLAFDCLLRISEFCKLQVSDVAFPGDLRMGIGFDEAALRLRSTKTGPNKSVRILTPAVHKLLRWWCSTRPASGPLFAFSAPQYRRAFRSICDGLGLDRTYVPHSLRHGGATALFNATKNIGLVMHHGRWAAERSARHYIQDGCAILISLNVPEKLARAARVLAKDLIGNLRRAVARSGGGSFGPHQVNYKTFCPA